MSERILPNETLAFGTHPRGCLQCGRLTFFEWLDSIALCSLGCLEELAEEWGREMTEGPNERTEYEQRIDAAPDVPEWWPERIYGERKG